MLTQETPKIMPSWKNLLPELAVLVLLFLLLEPPALAEVFSIPKGGASPINASEIRSFENGIKIHVKGRALRDVLQRIQNDSGISFSVQDGLADIKITAHFFALDWTSAVEKLLEDFSKMELLDQGQLHRVWLLGIGDFAEQSVQEMDEMLDETAQADKKKKIVRGRKYKIFLSEEELRKITQFPSIEPLSDYLIHDLRYRKFFEQFGLESLEDLKDMENTLTVHLEVRRQLRELEEQRGFEE